MPAATPKRLRLGRNLRLKQSRDFARVRREGQRAVLGCLIANWQRLPAESPSRLHFKRIAARAMRQVLVDAARRRHADKRGGGGETVLVTFDESLNQGPSSSRDVLSLDSALNDLARINPRQALMVECRFFGGLDVAETATLLEVSEATILRDWRAVKAWLANEVRRPA